MITNKLFNIITNHQIVPAFICILILPLTVFSQISSRVTVYDGALLITGNDGPVIEDGTLIVGEDRILSLGRKGEVFIPEGARYVDLTGKTIMPAIIDTHKHPSDQQERLTGQLKELASYGVGTVLSLGLDNSDTAHQFRNRLVPNASRYLTAGRGITTPEPGRSESAYGTPPAAYWITTAEEGREAVREQAVRGVDFIKIWVDDRGGRYEKMSPEMYTAIIDEAHQHGLPVAAHIHYLEDAKGLLKANLDVFAHGVRDQDVDEELIELFKQNPDVFLIPNLPDEGVMIDTSGLKGMIPDEVIDSVQNDYAGTAEDQAFYQIQARNLKVLNDAGVKIAFGTDGREMWEVFIEMENMVAAGMTPEEVIKSATRTAAELLSRDDIGTLTPGKIADFIVLDANPLDNIINIRSINAVYLRGEKVVYD